MFLYSHFFFFYSTKISQSDIIYDLVKEILGYMQNNIVLDIVQIYCNRLCLGEL